MTTNKKGQLTALLLSPIGLIVLAIGITAIAINFSGGGFLSIFGGNFEWNGMQFEDLGQQPQTQQCGGGFITSSVDNGEFLVISSTGQQNSVSRAVRTDITNMDEVLVVYDGFSSIGCNDRSVGVSSSLLVSVKGSTSGALTQSQSHSASSLQCEGRDGGVIPAKTYEPSVWKFKNNFDGTWSSLKYLGIGDIYIVSSKTLINGDKTYLEFEASSSGDCVGVGGSSFGRASSSLKIYNIVIKENSFAVCKVDEFGVDSNNDGKIDSNECVKTSSLVLNAEEAFQESIDEKFAHLEVEQAQKIAGLEAQIATLQKQGENTVALQAELDEAEARLADIEAKDKNVVAVIEGDEAFEKPSYFKNLINRLTSWLGNWLFFWND